MPSNPSISSDAADPAAAGREPTAVVVDDSMTSRGYLRAMLGRAGMRVVGEGASGDQALPLYEKHLPLLIILDIVLPGLDGVAAARQLLERHPDATVIMCSSMTARDKIVECHQAGVAHFIIKPFTAEKIASVVDSVRARQASAPGRKS